MNRTQTNNPYRLPAAQQAILIVSALVMIAGLILLHPAYRAFFGIPYTLILLGDIVVLLGSRSETFKRLMLMFSFIGALSAAVFMIRDLL